jgi:hypothetical protein
MTDIQDSPTLLLHGSCHCGAIQLTLPSLPEQATRCNCSICRRLGAVWAYYEFGTVEIQGHPSNTNLYQWGDKALNFVSCKHCACSIHWEPVSPQTDARTGINLNNFPPELLDSVNVRRFDGADTWAFLD